MRGMQCHTAVSNVSPTLSTYHEAIKSADTPSWLEAIKAEHNMIKRTGMYELINLPCGHKALGSKTVFKLKLKVDRTTNHYKAHIVVQGCGQ